MAQEERRKTDLEVIQRLAVVETLNANQSEQIKKILEEIKNVTAFIYEIKPQLDCLTGADLVNRLTKVETKQSLYTKVALGLITILTGLSAFREQVSKLFFG